MVIGREAETERLRSAFAAAAAGGGGVVFLTGEAGIGKSRLARELATEARARGAEVLAGRAVPTSVSVPYRPLSEVLLQAMRERPHPRRRRASPMAACAAGDGPPHRHHRR